MQQPRQASAVAHLWRSALNHTILKPLHCVTRCLLLFAAVCQITSGARGGVIGYEIVDYTKKTEGEVIGSSTKYQTPSEVVVEKKGPPDRPLWSSSVPLEQGFTVGVSDRRGESAKWLWDHGAQGRAQFQLGVVSQTERVGVREAAGKRVCSRQDGRSKQRSNRRGGIPE